MLAPAVFAASLRQPSRPPIPTASGEESEQRRRLPVATGAPQPTIFPAGQQQSPAEEITTTVPHTNRHVPYRGATITSTQLSQQVDR